MNGITNYSRAKIEGAKAAMSGIRRDKNPYPTFSDSRAWDDWNDGWDEAMRPDDDELAGGWPL